MNRCAVVIGVNKTGDLPVLSAAASGAKEFSTWAESQGIDIALLTDDNGNIITLRDVKNAIRTFVEQQTYSQLIVFFSGHGILRAPDYELWLLSGAPADPDEAINVPGSIWLARNAGIKHVVIISDACRSRPNTSRLSQIQGGVIFPNEAARLPRPSVDVFYATLPGDPALEVPAAESTNNYQGIFTECLLKGLRGNVPEVIVNIGPAGGAEKQWVIPSWEMKPYLEDEVPTAASRVSIKLQQDPDIRVESHPPHFLATVAPPSKTVTPKTQDTNRPVTVQHVVQSLKEDSYFQGHMQDTSLPADTRAVASESKLAKEMKRIIEVKGRESFETTTGFTVIGSKIRRAVATKSICVVFEESGLEHVRVHEEGKPQTVVIELADGTGIPLAVLPGSIGTVLIENDRVVNVSYVPSRGSFKYDNYQIVAKEIEERRAFAAAASRNGLFRFRGGIEALDGARYLRALKSIDPTLGLYAGYAYAQAGEFEEIESVYRYMQEEPEPILFDVALLAQKLNNKEQAVSPFCPMLTQGWAIMDSSNGYETPCFIRKLGRELLPGLWTTFSQEGARELLLAIEEGIIS